MAAGVIKCKSCGIENNVDANYCSSCGAKLKKHIHHNNVTTVTNQDKNLSMSKLGYILGGIILLGVFIVLMSGLFDKPEVNVNSFNPQQQLQNNQANPSANLNNLADIQRLENLVSSNPSDKLTVLKLAHLLNDSGFMQKAIVRYKEYLKLDDTNPDAWIDMGVCYYNLSDYDNAISAMKKGIEINPMHQIGHFNLGIVNSAMGNITKAKEFWSKAVALDPNSSIGMKAKNLINQN